jgi:indolepyruvate ferredoxin oxidoreductase
MYFEARNVGMKRLPPTPMGSEGVPWLGLAPFVDEPHLIQNLGDGTLSHSGTLAIRAAVAAGADMTFKVLYNSAVAMTGGQEVVGLLDVPSMTRSFEAEGVTRIVVCADDPKRYGRRARWAPGVEVLGRDELPAVQERLRSEPGVTVIIYDQVCAAEARRLRKRGELPEPPRRVVINEAVCEGCGDCSTKSNCLSVLPVETELGIKRQIHDPSCNRDYTCLDGDCPSFVTIVPLEAQDGSAEPERRVPVIPPGDLPLPALPEVRSQYGIYFTGIGGTGVVTANRVLARAADAMGLVIEGMDQTGLSQKAGAVVSHLHFAPDRSTVGSASIGPEGADAYLSGDLLQAAAAHHLERVRPGRTVAVVDATVSPTAAMLQADIATPSVTELHEAITARVGAERTTFVDSRRIAEAVFADHLKANIVLLGAAFQMGALPLPLDRLDAAMARGPWRRRRPHRVRLGPLGRARPGRGGGALDAVTGPGAPSAVAGAHEPDPSSVRAAEALVRKRTLPG